MMEQQPVSVLVVDDSALMRNVIASMIEKDPELRLEAKAANGAIALRKLESAKPDVIVLDLEMPVMTGLEFLEERRKRGIEIPVIILSSIASRGAKVTMEALALGASDFVTKPSGTDAGELPLVEQQLVALLKAFGRRHQRSTTVPVGRKIMSSSVASKGSPVQAVAIGISTGGPNALRKVFQELDPSLPVPVFVVQHMPAGFTREFAESLNRLSGLEVKEAETGDIARPGRAFIAPGDYHMTVVRRRLAVTIELNQEPLVQGHRPSADVLFSSMARIYGANSLAIIMTGMGRDGAAAIGDIRKAGGRTAAQDEESCVVYGMPRVAVENGHIDDVLPLEEVASYINRNASR
jgi:two-component system, chemotaxis family, protein-glutamate methylesterase/glutaminase